MQEVIMDEELQMLQDKFLNDNCEIFDDGDECGHEQFILFMDFKKMVEKHIETVRANP